MAKHEIPRIEVEVREQMGSRYAARLRDQKRLPGVIYGHKKEPVHISFDARQVQHLLHNQAHVLEVVYDSQAQSCLVKDVQWDYLGSNIIHLDLTRVDLSERVTTEVALELVGEPVGLKEVGAMLEHPYSTIEVECEAGNIPDAIRADVSHLEVGKQLSVGQLEMPEGVACTLAPETVLASILIVMVTEEEEPAEEVVDESAEPEVITAKKEESENEAGDAKKEET